MMRIELRKNARKALLKLLDAVRFQGTHELPHDFWRESEYLALEELRLRLRVDAGLSLRETIR